MRFVVRQFFLRDYPEEKALLESLAEALANCDGLVTFNGKTFDVPLLETRYALARLRSPFERLAHFDALHPARRLWKLRLESCKLTVLEEAILGIAREGDVAGSEIPAIYFDYLRSGDARGLQPVFYHNALDVVSLAALTVELARTLGEGGAESLDSPLDLFSLSRILGSVGSNEKSITTCRQALAEGLPEQIESLALKHLAAEFKRQRQHESAVELWLELSRREPPLALKPWRSLPCIRSIAFAILNKPSSSRLPRSPTWTVSSLPPGTARDLPGAGNGSSESWQGLRRRSSGKGCGSTSGLHSLGRGLGV